MAWPNTAVGPARLASASPSALAAAAAHRAGGPKIREGCAGAPSSLIVPSSLRSKMLTSSCRVGLGWVEWVGWVGTGSAAPLPQAGAWWGARTGFTARTAKCMGLSRESSYRHNRSAPAWGVEGRSATHRAARSTSSWAQGVHAFTRMRTSVASLAWRTTVGHRRQGSCPAAPPDKAHHRKRGSIGHAEPGAAGAPARRAAAA